MAKAYYTISEVSELVGVKPHVLRYWEATLGMPRPKRKGGKRFYSAEDIRVSYLIKILLYKHGYTLDKVSEMLKQHGFDRLSPVVLDPLIRDIKEELYLALEELAAIKEILEER